MPRVSTIERMLELRISVLNEAWPESIFCGHVADGSPGRDEFAVALDIFA